MEKNPDLPKTYGKKQLRRIMKLSLILFTMGITTLLATPGNAQPEKVNLELKNVTVREVFKEIEKQSNYVIPDRASITGYPDAGIPVSNGGSGS